MYDNLESRVDKLVGVLERMRLDEYIEHVSNRKRLLLVNIAYGLARGFGFMLGFSVLGAVALVLLSRVAANSVPLIGDFLTEVLEEVEMSR